MSITRVLIHLRGAYFVKKQIHCRYSLLSFLLPVLLCSIYLTGCSKDKPLPAPSVETTSPISDSDSIQIGGISWDLSAQEVTVANADPLELKQILPAFPNLKRLILEGTIPATEQLLELHSHFSQVELVCPVTIGTETFFTDAEVLDFSNTTVDFSSWNKLLPLFFNLKELTLKEAGLTDAEIMMVCDSLPDVLIHCDLPLAGQYYDRNSLEIDLSGCPVSVAEVEQMLPYFPRLRKLDLSFCGISDEEMDALNQRYPEISIVWTVTIGEVKTRTDAVYFYPAESNYYPKNEEMKKLRYCTELVAIDIGHTRATDCEFLWYTPKVRYLILADTGITDITPVGNLKELIYLELFNLRTKDYSPLLNCTKLQDLNIGTTHADPEPLSKMTWLHNLQWHRADQDPATKEAVLKLPEQLPDTNVELYPRKKARNIGGGWRYIPNYYVFRDIIGATYFNQDQIWDYWGDTDGDRIMACESGKSFAAYTLAEIVRERINRGEPIVGLKNNDSEKAEILYQTLMEAESWITEDKAIK